MSPPTLVIVIIIIIIIIRSSNIVGQYQYCSNLMMSTTGTASTRDYTEKIVFQELTKRHVT